MRAKAAAHVCTRIHRALRFQYAAHNPHMPFVFRIGNAPKRNDLRLRYDTAM